ncbi:hypothetical protein Tco_0209947, partial [Tanacetum coccineum]
SKDLRNAKTSSSKVIEIGFEKPAESSSPKHAKIGFVDILSLKHAEIKFDNEDSIVDRGEYSQWHERFMNYLEEQTNGEAMIHSITLGEQPLPVVTQVSLAGTAPNAHPVLKDPKLWSSEEERLLIQSLVNDIYSLVDSTILLKSYGMHLKGRCVVLIINDLKRCGYKKDNCELDYKFLNNLQQEWKQYGTLMRQTKNLMDINIDALYNILKQNQGDVNNASGIKKKVVVVTSHSLALVVEKAKVKNGREKVVVHLQSEESDNEDINDLKKITALLSKAINRNKYYDKPTNNNLRTSSVSTSAKKKPKYVKSKENRFKSNL